MKIENSPSISSTEKEFGLSSALFVPYTEELIKYLEGGYKSNNANHLNRIFAFNDLIKRCYYNDIQKLNTINGIQKFTSTSLGDLASAWGWSRQVVWGFAKTLESFGIITTKIQSGQKILSLCPFAPLPYNSSFEDPKSSQTQNKEVSDNSRNASLLSGEERPLKENGLPSK